MRVSRALAYEAFRSEKGSGMHVNVLLAGRLVGMGQQAECEVMARRLSANGSGEILYSDPVVIHAPNELPEGEYTLLFENVSTPVLHKGVLWMSSAPPPMIETESNVSGGAAPPRPGRSAVGLARRMIRDRRKKS